MEKILVVDDDVENRMLVINALSKTTEKYSVLVASDGEMAVNIASKTLPSLILMDWEMPKMNGLDALKELKRIALTQNIPVVMYTGIMTSSDALQEALEAGAIEFLRKPVEKVELLARVKSIVALQKSIKAQIQAEKDKAALLEELKNQELSLKTKELAGLVLQINQNHSFLNVVLHNLDSIQQQVEKKTPQMQVKKLVRLINNNIHSEEYWAMFKKRIDSIYGGFLERVVKKHPTLSNGELKLCSFLKLNLSRKEIAKILNVTVEAVKKSRSRLRKKLNLSPDLRLEIYLKQI